MISTEVKGLSLSDDRKIETEVDKIVELNLVRKNVSKLEPKFVSDRT